MPSRGWDPAALLVDRGERRGDAVRPRLGHHQHGQHMPQTRIQVEHGAGDHQYVPGKFAGTHQPHFALTDRPRRHQPRSRANAVSKAAWSAACSGCAADHARASSVSCRNTAWDTTCSSQECMDWLVRSAAPTTWACSASSSCNVSFFFDITVKYTVMI